MVCSRAGENFVHSVPSGSTSFAAYRRKIRGRHGGISAMCSAFGHEIKCPSMMEANMSFRISSANASPSAQLLLGNNTPRVRATGGAPTPPLSHDVRLNDRQSDDAARSVMTRYDLHNISYNELVQLAGELKGIGALKEEDYLDFIGPSPEWATLNEQRDITWSSKVDYVSFHEQQVESLRASGAENRFLEFANSTYLRFKYFASLQSNQT